MLMFMFMIMLLEFIYLEIHHSWLHFFLLSSKYDWFGINQSSRCKILFKNMANLENHAVNIIWGFYDFFLNQGGVSILRCPQGYCNPLPAMGYFLVRFFLMEPIYYDIIFPFQLSKWRNLIPLLKTGPIFTRNARLDMNFIVLLHRAIVQKRRSLVSMHCQYCGIRTFCQTKKTRLCLLRQVSCLQKPVTFSQNVTIKSVPLSSSLAPKEALCKQ